MAYITPAAEQVVRGLILYSLS